MVSHNYKLSAVEKVSKLKKKEKNNEKGGNKNYIYTNNFTNQYQTFTLRGKFCTYIILAFFPVYC